MIEHEPTSDELAERAAAQLAEVQSEVRLLSPPRRRRWRLPRLHRPAVTPDLAEVHMYAGVLFASAGLAVAVGVGAGLMVLGIGLVTIGVLIAQGVRS